MCVYVYINMPALLHIGVDHMCIHMEKNDQID